ARGELWEALDGVHAIRSLALVPLLEWDAGKAPEGARRLESRVSDGVQTRLAATVCGLDAVGLFGAKRRSSYSENFKPESIRAMVSRPTRAAPAPSSTLLTKLGAHARRRSRDRPNHLGVETSEYPHSRRYTVRRPAHRRGRVSPQPSRDPIAARPA